MASQQKVSTNPPRRARSSGCLGRSRGLSAGLEHLWCMTLTTPSSTPNSTLDPVLTLSQLATQLGVTVQTLYDLRCPPRTDAASAPAGRSLLEVGAASGEDALLAAVDGEPDDDAVASPAAHRPDCSAARIDSGRHTNRAVYGSIRMTSPGGQRHACWSPNACVCRHDGA